MRHGLPVLLLYIAAPCVGANYARPELLYEAEQVAGSMQLYDPSSPLAGHRMVVLDVRPQESDPLPGFPLRVNHVDAVEWKRAFGSGDDAAGWSKRISEVVDRPDTVVVVLDESFTPTAARVWWILKYWGLKDVRVFNGGATAWRRYRVEHDWVAGVEPVGKKRERIPVVAKPDQRRHATLDDVLAIAKGESPACCLLDTRSDREVAAGVIPSAKHAEWTRFVDPKTGRLRPADRIKTILDEAGFDPAAPAVSYCQSGGRAALVAFVMELMGGEQVANYVGSWGEWSGRGPIVTLGK